MQIWRLSAHEHVLLIVQHHSITDGVSLGILGRDLATAYHAALSASKPEWQPLSIAYVDYASWQRATLDAAALEAELAWWKQTLSGAPGLLELPIDRPRPTKMSFAGAKVSFATSAAVRQGLQQLAKAQQTTPFVVVMAALQASHRTPSAAQASALHLSALQW